MKIITQTLNIETKKEFEFIKITEKIKSFVKESKIKNGFINIFSRHTTLAIKINEFEKLLLKDFWSLMKKISNSKEKYFHDMITLRNCPPNEPKNARGHLRCLLLETSQTIPISNSEMQLGKFQDIIAIETSGPRKREIIMQICGNF